MHAERRIFGNSALLIALEAAGQALNLVMVVLLTRWYGVGSLGAYSFAMAMGATLATVATLGATTYATREISRDAARAPDLIAAIAPAQATAALLGAAGFATWAVLTIEDAGTGYAIAAVATSHLVSRMGGIYLVPFIADERFGTAGWREFAERLLALGLFAACGAAGCDFATATLSLPVAATAGLAAAWWSARRRLPGPWPLTDVAAIVAALRSSLPFLGTALVSTLYQRGGLLVLTAMGGTLAAGTFAAAERLLVPVAMLYGTFAAAAFPSLARLARDAIRLRELAGRCLRIDLVATTGLSALIALLAPDLVRIVWGHPVPEAVPVLRVLAVGVVLRSIAALLGAQCHALGAEADAARARLAALVAFGIVSIPAARFGGALGLAVAAAASDLLLVARMSAVLRRRAQLRFPVAAASRPLGAILATLALNALAPAMPFWGRAVAATAMLGLAMFASGSIRLHDLRFLRDILRDRSPA